MVGGEEADKGLSLICSVCLPRVISQTAKHSNCGANNAYGEQRRTDEVLQYLGIQMYLHLFSRGATKPLNKYNRLERLGCGNTQG